MGPWAAVRLAGVELPRAHDATLGVVHHLLPVGPARAPPPVGSIASQAAHAEGQGVTMPKGDP